jgi:type IV secretion system protein VirB9
MKLSFRKAGNPASHTYVSRISRKAALPLILLATTALAGCATTQKPPEISYDDAAPAARTVDPPAPVTVVELPRPLPLPGQMKPVVATRSAPEASDPAVRVNQANAAARVQPVRNGFINSMQVYPFTQGALYQVYTAVGQITDIALQPGEQLVGSGPVAAGDTVRWIIGDTESGTGATRQIHILVKPTRAELMTNLVINTNLRTYHMELRSTERTYMASVSWQYPQDQLIALRRQNTEAQAAQPVATGIDISRVNFRYEIDGDRAPWRPLRAFDDGRQVFIEFPRGIGQGEMPPLFVVGPEGNTSELVNYRVRGNHMIVDRLFAAAELRFGTGDHQKRVRITRTDGRPAS